MRCSRFSKMSTVPLFIEVPMQQSIKTKVKKKFCRVCFHNNNDTRLELLDLFSVLIHHPNFGVKTPFTHPKVKRLKSTNV